MAVQMTIRDVPEQVRDRLAVLAAQRSQSVQKFLLGELERIASRPSNAELMEAIRRRKEATGTHITAAMILEARDADRR
jgi:hypothetical protein